ncbi:MAG: hypothetical protein AAF184_10160 [Pseudomonadota bacterium]
MSSPIRTVFLVVLSLLILSVDRALAAAPAPEIPDEWPTWLKEAMATERKKRKRTKPATAGDLQMKVLGKLTETENMEGSLYFAVDIGADVPASCWVYGQPQYMATTVKLLVDALLAENARVNDTPIKQRIVYYNDFGVIEDMPYMANEWLWVIERDGETNIGLLKMRAAQKDGTLFVCAHDQLGYRETFAALFDQVMRSATWPHDYQAPYLRGIHTFTVAGRPAGLAWHEMRQAEDGDTVTVVEMSMALQVDEFTLSTSDSKELARSTSDGQVINAFSESAENGEVTTALKLRADESGNWSVTGRMQGKEVAFDLGDEVRPLSILGESLTMRALLKDDTRTSAQIPVWVTGADPSSFITAEFALGKRGKKTSQGSYSVGPIAIEGEYEHETGSMLNGSMSMAGITMSMELVYSSGELP